jgi:outer membrane lipoprotein LolB
LTPLRHLSLIFLLFLGACANTSGIKALPRQAQPDLLPFAFNGRVAIKHNGERSSAGVRWTHHRADDEILLLAPLGQTVARIFSDAHGVVLETGGEQYYEENAENLTRRILGWNLPLNGLRYWVLALPSSGSEATISRAENGQIKELHQDGWKIVYTRYAAESADSLPLRLTLQHKDIELQLLIDEWEI